LEILVANSAGFCFGVNRAVDAVHRVINKKESPIYTLGPIIHNEQVVRQLESKGVRVAGSAEELTAPCTVVIRAHGVTPEVYKALIDKNIKVIDATCPYVKKIHMLVKEMYEKGYQIIIIGDPDHPEVIGINGWCNNTAYIADDAESVDELPSTNMKCCVVAQTTITKEKWDTVNEKLKKKFENITKFDTICNATNKRQKDAGELAGSVDMMLVIGSKNSSNTNKLYEICKAYCPETYNIETSGEIPPVDIKKIKKVGITAGASTPDWVIKEVISKMEELNKQDNEMSFKEAFEESLVTLRSGEIVKGKIIGFNNNEVFIDMGYKSDGIIPMDEFDDSPEFNPETDLKSGEEIDVFIVRVNDGEGNVLLSKKKVDSMKGWNEIEEAYKNNTPVKVKITETTKGGLIGTYKGLKVFIPASQASDRFVKDLSKFLKQVMDIRIIELNKHKKRIVGSHRILVQEQKEKLEREIWGQIEVGKEYTGTVQSLTDFGAFVDIGGVDGLIHISELSWNKIKHPSEVLKEGEKVEVIVQEFDKEKNRISLAYKNKGENPWVIAARKYSLGDEVKGRVVRLVPFGAFVELEKGVDGLVHISQISNVRIAKPGDVLSVGQEVDAKIIEMDIDAKKISLSIKEVNPIDPKQPDSASGIPEEKEEELPSEHREEMNVTLGDLIDSEQGKEEAKGAELNK
jgi:small subunit ribosomal protein S1